jgi:hypothetical protein
MKMGLLTTNQSQEQLTCLFNQQDPRLKAPQEVENLHS